MREIIIRLALAAVACWVLVLQHGLVPMFETTLRHPNVILANILGGWPFSPDERLAYFGSATAFGVAIVLWIVTPLLEDFFSYQRGFWTRPVVLLALAVAIVLFFVAGGLRWRNL